jgi:hypothetical protein
MLGRDLADPLRLRWLGCNRADGGVPGTGGERPADRGVVPGAGTVAFATGVVAAAR